MFLNPDVSGAQPNDGCSSLGGSSWLYSRLVSLELIILYLLYFVIKMNLN